MAEGDNHIPGPDSDGEGAESTTQNQHKFRRLIQIHLATQLEYQKLPQPGKDQCLPSVVRGGQGVQRVTPRTKSPRRRVRVAHPRGSGTVFRLRPLLQPHFHTFQATIDGQLDMFPESATGDYRLSFAD